jgi:hypothetical protein
MDLFVCERSTVLKNNKDFISFLKKNIVKKAKNPESFVKAIGFLRLDQRNAADRILEDGLAGSLLILQNPVFSK